MGSYFMSQCVIFAWKLTLVESFQLPLRVLITVGNFIIWPISFLGGSPLPLHRTRCCLNQEQVWTKALAYLHSARLALAEHRAVRRRVPPAISPYHTTPKDRQTPCPSIDRKWLDLFSKVPYYIKGGRCSPSRMQGVCLPSHRRLRCVTDLGRNV